MTIIPDYDPVIYEIRKDEIVIGNVKYSSGEFYSDEFGFHSHGISQGQSLGQLSDFIKAQEKRGYQFIFEPDPYAQSQTARTGLGTPACEDIPQPTE
ncbi:hypothetical protein [Nodosilinea nodulosa]|uniref:hypothetical protein n=1 Tax=Nodosilinea nodulosa TaxID=416001 RepID=UPI0002EE73B0|nr:hypothetical protein [Nodosilinea nodulosa]